LQLKLFRVGKEESSEGNMTTNKELSKENIDTPGEVELIIERNKDVATEMRRFKRVKRKPIYNFKTI